MKSALHKSDGREGEQWREGQLAGHENFRRELIGLWNKTATSTAPGLQEHQLHRAAAAANNKLRETVEQMTITGGGALGGFRLDCDDSELCEKADLLAREGAIIWRRWGDDGWQKSAELCGQFGVDYPEEKQSDLFGRGPAMRRVACEKWWRRQLRKMQGRKLEEIARDMRIVNQRKQIYCSDFNVKRRAEQKARNRKTLERLQATNDQGDTFTLAELADKSVSKAENRRAELMVRIRGFQEYAESQEHKLLFITVTCPSEYHPYSGGGENAKYSGKTVRDSGGHLSESWARCRAYLARKNCRQYGFRVAEPHHDGTVHYHYLLFCDPSHCREIARGFEIYFREQHSPNEHGAKRYRVNIKKNLPTAAAAGYVAKYISKNIDGYQVGSDLYGHDAVQSASRIDAWASVHGVRQFQQIGGPSVTVWRELRRLSAEDAQAHGQHFAEIHSKADASDWAAFVAMMGGGFVVREAQPIRPDRWKRVDQHTGEIIDPIYTEYGEPAESRVLGVCYYGRRIMTRLYRWAVEWVQEAREAVQRVRDYFDDHEYFNLLGYGVPPSGAT